MDFEGAAAILLFFGFLVAISDANGNAWSQQDGNGWNLQNGGENNFGSWSSQDSQLTDGDNWSNQLGGGRWGRQEWSSGDGQSKVEGLDNTQAKEWSGRNSPAQGDGNQRSSFSPSDAQVKDYGKWNKNQGNFRPEDSQSKDWNKDQGNFRPEDSQSKDWDRNQGNFRPEDSQSKDWNNNQGNFKPEDSQSKDWSRNQENFRPDDSQSKDWNNNQGNFKPEDSQSKDWNRNQDTFEPADGQKKVSSDWSNDSGRDNQSWHPDDSQVKNENWGQKKIDDRLNEGEIRGDQTPGVNRNWGQGKRNGDGSVVQGGNGWNRGQDLPSFGAGEGGDQGPTRGGPSIGQNQGVNGDRWDGDVTPGRTEPDIGQGKIGPSVGQDQGTNGGQWDGNNFPEGIGKPDGQKGIEPSIGQGGIGPTIGQGGIGPSIAGGIEPPIGQGEIGPSIGQGGIQPPTGQGERGVPQEGSLGERGDVGGDTNELFPPRVPQGNYKGGDTPHPGDEDPGQWRLEDSIPGQPGVDYPNYSTVPQTGFDCKQQENPGYYGDVEARCQVFHICQSDGRHDSFLCPLGTVFNQQHFVCVWWFDYNCDDTQMYYTLNADLYKVNAQGNFKGDDYRPPQDQPGRRLDQPGPLPNVDTPAIGRPIGADAETVTGPNPIYTELDVVPSLGDDPPGGLEVDYAPDAFSPGVTSEQDNGLSGQGPVYGPPSPSGIPLQDRGVPNLETTYGQTNSARSPMQGIGMPQQKPAYEQPDQTGPPRLDLGAPSQEGYGPPRLDPGAPPQEGFIPNDVIDQQGNNRGNSGPGIRGTGGKTNLGSNWESNRGSSAADGNWRSGVKGGWKSPDESARGRKARSWGSHEGLEKRFGSEGAAASNWITLEHGLDEKVGRERNGEWEPERNGNQVQWDDGQMQWESGLKDYVEEVGGRSGEADSGDREPERNEKEVKWIEGETQWRSGRNEPLKSPKERNSGEEGPRIVENEVSPRIWRTIEPVTNVKRNWWQDELGAVKRRRRDAPRRWRTPHRQWGLSRRWN